MSTVLEAGPRLQDGPLEFTRPLTEEAIAPKCPIPSRGQILRGWSSTGV